MSGSFGIPDLQLVLTTHEEAPLDISVVIVDDHKLLVDALVDTLDDTDDLTVVGTAGTLAEALPLAVGHEPDVVLLDHRLGDSDGATATRRILEDCPDCSVLLMSAAEPATMLAEAMEAGIAGFVHKSRGMPALVEALRTVAGGGTVFEAEDLQAAVQRLGGRGGDSPLTERELEVLQLLAEGMNVEAIAEQLTLSHHTVRNHVRHVLEKLDAHSQLEAVAIGLRHGLVTPPGRGT